MEYSPILAPVVVLVVWTLIMMAWMAVTRFAAFKQMGITLGKVPRGSRGVDLEGQAPNEIMWKSHNYTHLVEQPTVFYAIALTLALMGMGGGINLWLAWGYVAFRVLHSIVQCTVNQLTIRTPLFVLASLCLLGLTVHAAASIIHYGTAH